MPNYQKHVVYLSEQQRQELFTNGSITVDGKTVTYSDSDMYVTPQEVPYVKPNTGIPAEDLADGVVPVQDVQVDGQSILQDGVANVPVASGNVLGAVKVDAANGVGISQSTNKLLVFTASDAAIKNGTNAYTPITPTNQNKATFYGLAKAAGDTTQSQSANPVGTYTDEAKDAIQTMLGFDEVVEDAGKLLIVSDNEPEEEHNKIWIKNDAEETFVVPTYEEFEEVKNSQITDVQINGSSVVTNGVANVPKVSSTNLGVAKTNTVYGIGSNTDGSLMTYPANNVEIKGGSEYYRPINPASQHRATFYGLAKVAGVDLANETITLGTYTDAAKIAIQKMLGIYQAPWELIREDTVTNAESADINITVDGNGQAFELTDVMLMFETPQQETASSANGDVYLFYSANDYIRTASGSWSQNANASSNGIFVSIDNKSDMIVASCLYRTGAGVSTLRSSYGVGFNGPNMGSRYISGFKITKIQIKSVTGTGHYKLYGKRKWN